MTETSPSPSGTGELESVNRQLARVLHTEPADLSLGAENAMVDDLVICGIVGGKDVGKTTIINALAGMPISNEGAEVGRGTDRPMVYVHEDVAVVARNRLQMAEIGVEVDIVTHRADAIRNAALLDLPDFDSEFQEHFTMVRRLAPLLDRVLWVQTPRKIGDRLWVEMFDYVIKDPENIYCVLNKFDELLADDRLNGSDGASSHASHEEAAAAFWKSQNDWVSSSVASSGCHLDRDRLFLVSAAFSEQNRFVDEIARRWGDPDWSQYADDRPTVATIAEMASREFDRLRKRLLDPVSADQAAAIKKANRSHERRTAAERIRKHYNLDQITEQLRGACDPDYLQSVYSEAAGPTYGRDVAAHLATQVRRDTALADELLERRVEHWPLLRLVYWPLGFLSRMVGSRLTGRGRRTETVVGEPFRIDGRPLADRIGLMRSRLLADHTAIASDLKLENEMPKDSYLAGRVEAATSRLIPEFEDHLLDGIRTRDRRPSIIGKMMLWLIALWFPILQPVLEGGLEMYLQDGRFAIVHGLYRIVSAFSAVHLLTGLAVVVIVFVALLAAMYARALRAVRLALDPKQGLDSSTQLAGFVEEILVNETVAPLARPFQNHLRELEALRSRLDSDDQISD